MNRSRGKSQVSIGIVLIALAVISSLIILAPTITGLFVGNFTIPINFTNVTEQVCHNETIETNCYNETVDVCTNVFNGTKQICENQTICNYPETNETNINWTEWNQTYCSEELVCYEQDIYSPVCHQETRKICDERNITVCENKTIEQVNFTLKNDTGLKGDTIIKKLSINPRFGRCDENYTINMEVYHNKGLNFTLHLWMIDYPDTFAKIMDVNVSSGTNENNTKKLNLKLENLCEYNLSIGSELMINSSTSNYSVSQENFVSGLPIVGKNYTVEEDIEPRLIIKKVEYPSFIYEKEPFETKVFLTSYGKNYSSIIVNISSPLLENMEKYVDFVKKDELVLVTFRTTPISCGNTIMGVSISDSKGKLHSKSYPFFVSCESFSVDLNKKIKEDKLEIEVVNASDGYFLDRDPETFEKVQKRYVKIFLDVFNSFYKESGSYNFEDKVTIYSITLKDEFGNTYNSIPISDIPPLRYLEDEDFGKYGDLHPQTGKKGYVVFSGVSPNSNELNLIFDTDVGLVIFKFNREGEEIV